MHQFKTLYTNESKKLTGIPAKTLNTVMIHAFLLQTFSIRFPMITAPIISAKNNNTIAIRLHFSTIVKAGPEFPYKPIWSNRIFTNMKPATRQ